MIETFSSTLNIEISNIISHLYPIEAVDKRKNRSNVTDVFQRLSVSRGKRSSRLEVQEFSGRDKRLRNIYFHLKNCYRYHLPFIMVVVKWGFAKIEFSYRIPANRHQPQNIPSLEWNESHSQLHCSLPRLLPTYSFLRKGWPQATDKSSRCVTEPCERELERFGSTIPIPSEPPLAKNDPSRLQRSASILVVVASRFVQDGHFSVCRSNYQFLDD